jgi:hypothetical protein
MKKCILIVLFLFFFFNIKSQEIYKGLMSGMSKLEAKKQFKKNRDTYITVDFTNGFNYRIYRQNFMFINDKLAALVFSPKGYVFGMDYDSTRNYLIHTRNFFEDLNYVTFIDDEYWNSPINYVSSGSKWGLVLHNEEKTKIIQMFTERYMETSFLVVLSVWNYDVWMNLYNKEESIQSKKKIKSGF